MNDVSTAPRAAKPDHVPADLVRDYDIINGAEHLRDPYAHAIGMMDDVPPIFWTPRNNGHWVVARYETISAAFRDWQHFSSKIVPDEFLELLLKDLPPGSPTPLTSIPANVDPPLHDTYRHPINVAFSPKVAAGLKEEVRGLAVELIEAIRPQGHCELMSEVTEPLPINMFLKLFGLPLEKRHDYRALIKSQAGSQLQDVNALLRNARRLVDAFTDDLIERRDDPRDDIISMLWKLEIDGAPITLHTMQSFCLTLFLAGLDTVTNTMALGTRHLAAHPELQEEMRSDPKKIPLVVEELMRLYTISAPIRTVARDGEFQGVTMKKGEHVHFFLIGADRDPDQFDDPNDFRVDRRGAHLAFGMGPHRCLGMHLARVEMHVYYEELMKRMPPFRLDPDKPTTFHGGVTMGPNEVHLRWD